MQRTYDADDVRQGIRILRDYITNHWDDRWYNDAASLAPRPRVATPYEPPSPRRNPDQPPLFLPDTPTPPSELENQAGAGPSQHPHADPSKRKRSRGGSEGDSTLATPPSHSSPPAKRVTRSASGDTHTKHNESPPLKIGRPTRSAQQSKAKKKDAEASDSSGGQRRSRRSGREATEQTIPSGTSRLSRVELDKLICMVV